MVGAGDGDGTRPTRRTLRALDQLPTSVLAGVGPRKAAALSAMGLETVLDLLMHYPRRYVDRSHLVEMAHTVPGEEALVSGTVERVSTRRPRRGRPMVEVVVADGTGTVVCTFFNQPWRANQLREGLEVAAFGKIDEYRGRPQLVNPELDVIGTDAERRTGRVIAIYQQSGKAGIGSSELARYLEEVLDRARDFDDPLPERWRGELGLADRTTAFRAIHVPPEWGLQRPARRRLAFDELLRLQLELVIRKRAAERAARGISHAVGPGAGRSPGLVASFFSQLPFPLTGAQLRAIDEIAGDLARPAPMHRLLQGDVGAGKTVVALAALLQGVQGGCQGALMVPTEVLAEQHFLAAGTLLGGLTVADETRLGGTRPLAVALLTSRTPAGERAKLRAGLSDGSVDILVGTHALLTEDVRFSALGVVVIDEQHRFGVEQRAALRDKAAGGHDPDVLVMTATPIPRTAAMTVYGDLDQTVLDEMPAGRTPVVTRWCQTEEQEARAWDRVRAEVAAGRQAYVVCPLVAGDADDAGAEEAADPGDTIADGGCSDGRLDLDLDLDLDPDLDPGLALAPGAADHRPPRSVVDEHRRFTDEGGELAGLAVGLLHGQLPPRRKEEVMAAFRSGELSVLVATTVIEVGVDVTDATVMVIEDADRFGIAQLHQLRGRVGRGTERSWCFLLASQATPDGTQRLRALERTTDGFELAEVDLELRGEGTVLGTRQKGRNGLRLASIRRDRDLVTEARRVAVAIVDEDPKLDRHERLADELRLFIDEQEAEFLFKS